MFYNRRTRSLGNNIEQGSSCPCFGGERRKIVVDADSVTYPIIKKGEKTDKIFKISDIKHLKYDDEEGELEIFLTDDTQITLHAGFFESFERYEEFFALLKK